MVMRALNKVIDRPRLIKLNFISETVVSNIDNIDNLLMGKISNTFRFLHEQKFCLILNLK